MNRFDPHHKCSAACLHAVGLDASSTGTLLLSLSTIAGAKISNPSWVIFQSAGWVSFQSAPTLNDIMRKNGNECVTLKWDQFYKICERDRLADVVMESISKQVKKFDLHVIYGNNVIVVRDFCWRPVTL